MTTLLEAKGVDHHSTVACSAKTSGTVEWQNQEAIRTAKALLGETVRMASVRALMVSVM